MGGKKKEKDVGWTVLVVTALLTAVFLWVATIANC